MSAKRCWYCFGNKGNAQSCPFCGAAEGGRNKEDQLQSSMELKDRYVIGGAADGGKNGVIYLAVDLGEGGRLVRLKEFLPKDYARRSDLNYDVITDDVDAAVFEKRKRLIFEQAKELVAQGKYSDVFEQNNTVYVCQPLKKPRAPQLSEREEEQYVGVQYASVESEQQQELPPVKPVPDIPEYTPPTAPAAAFESSQSGDGSDFSTDQGSRFDFDVSRSQPLYTVPENSFDMSASATREGFKDPDYEQSADDDLYYSEPGGDEWAPEESFFDKLKKVLGSAWRKLKSGVNALLDKLAAAGFICKMLELTDKLLRKERFDESEKELHRRRRIMAGAFIIALLLLAVLVIVLIGAGCSGGSPDVGGSTDR